MADSPDPLPMITIASDADCESAIARLGELDRLLTVIETDKAKAVAAAGTKAETLAAAPQGHRLVLVAAIAAYCDANRQRLLESARGKTATFSTGEVSWRKGRDTVEIDETRLAKIILRLKRLKLTRMIKTTEAVIKSAVLNERDKVKGIRGLRIVERGEEIAIKPLTAELAPARTDDRPAA